MIITGLVCVLNQRAEVWVNEFSSTVFESKFDNINLISKSEIKYTITTLDLHVVEITIVHLRFEPEKNAKLFYPLQEHQ